MESSSVYGYESNGYSGCYNSSEGHESYESVDFAPSIDVDDKPLIDDGLPYDYNSLESIDKLIDKLVSKTPRHRFKLEEANEYLDSRASKIEQLKGLVNDVRRLEQERCELEKIKEDDKALDAAIKILKKVYDEKYL